MSLISATPQLCVLIFISKEIKYFIQGFNSYEMS
jgi:hypothetical protein